MSTGVSTVKEACHRQCAGKAYGRRPQSPDSVDATDEKNVRLARALRTLLPPPILTTNTTTCLSRNR